MQSRAVLLVAFASVTALLAWLYGPRASRWLHRLFSYPAYGDTPLCPHCLLPLPSPSFNFCPACRLPLTGIAATDPILRIASIGALYRRGSQRLVGFGLAGVVLLVLPPCALAVLWLLDDDVASARAALLTAVPWLVVLLKAIWARLNPPDVADSKA